MLIFCEIPEFCLHIIADYCNVLSKGKPTRRELSQNLTIDNITCNWDIKLFSEGKPYAGRFIVNREKNIMRQKRYLTDLINTQYARVWENIYSITGLLIFQMILQICKCSCSCSCERMLLRKLGSGRGWVRSLQLKILRMLTGDISIWFNGVVYRSDIDFRKVC